MCVRVCVCACVCVCVGTLAELFLHEFGAGRDRFEKGGLTHLKAHRCVQCVYMCVCVRQREREREREFI